LSYKQTYAVARGVAAAYMKDDQQDFRTRVGGGSTMQTENRFLDDLARVASGALGSLAGVRNEVEVRLKQQFKRILSEMDSVPREEFDAVKAMAANARKEQLSLEKRIAALEAAAAGQKSKAASGRSARGARGSRDPSKTSTAKGKPKSL
jgi:BMFP domain-containing protein YqiC